MRLISVYLITAICLLSSALNISAQPTNLLLNPKADEDTKYWRMSGDAKIEQTSSGEVFFVVRNSGSFGQEVELDADAVGKFALFLGRASSERINRDGSITGLPYIYGYMIGTTDGRILSYLQGQRMRLDGRSENDWGPVWGIFPIPPDTRRIVFFLNQAQRRGSPQNGSAARFDDLGLYLFPTEKEARAFVPNIK